MTKKNFEAIAKILNADRAVSRDAQEAAKVRCIALSLSDYFLSVNPLFDRQKFLTACGFPSAHTLTTSNF